MWQRLFRGLTKGCIVDIRSWTRAIRKSWWIVLVASLIGLIAGVGVILASPNQYASGVTFFVRTPTEQVGGGYQGDQFAQKRVNSYVQLAESKRLAELVLNETQLSFTPGQLISRISAKGDLNTVLLTITVTDTDAQRSLDIAGSVSRQFVNLVAELETPPGGSVPSISLDVVSSPTLDPTPVAPRKLQILVIATLLGLLVGIVVAIGREVLNTTIRSVQMLKTEGLSVLAVIPFDGTAKTHPLISDSHSTTPRAEAFRQLRTNLDFADVDNPVRSVVVTSSVPDEGKSTTATNIALAFAEAGKRVLLIEADMRRPRVAEYLGLDGTLGLTNVLAGQATVDDVLQPWGRGGLSVLPCGPQPPNPSELLSSQNMKALLAELRSTFDLVVIDTPPLLPVTDAAIAAAISDGAILIVRHGRATRQQLGQCRDALAAVDARLLGAVLSMSPMKGPDAYEYGGYYSTEPSSAAPAAVKRGVPQSGDDVVSAGAREIGVQTLVGGEAERDAVERSSIAAER